VVRGRSGWTIPGTLSRDERSVFNRALKLYLTPWGTSSSGPGGDFIRVWGQLITRTGRPRRLSIHSCGFRKSGAKLKVRRGAVRRTAYSTSRTGAEQRLPPTPGARPAVRCREKAARGGWAATSVSRPLPLAPSSRRWRDCGGANALCPDRGVLVRGAWRASLQSGRRRRFLVGSISQDPQAGRWSRRDGPPLRGKRVGPATPIARAARRPRFAPWRERERLGRAQPGREAGVAHRSKPLHQLRVRAPIEGVARARREPQGQASRPSGRQVGGGGTGILVAPGGELEEAPTVAGDEAANSRPVFRGDCGSTPQRGLGGRGRRARQWPVCAGDADLERLPCMPRAAGLRELAGNRDRRAVIPEKTIGAGRAGLPWRVGPAASTGMGAQPFQAVMGLVTTGSSAPLQGGIRATGRVAGVASFRDRGRAGKAGAPGSVFGAGGAPNGGGDGSRGRLGSGTRTRVEAIGSRSCSGRGKGTPSGPRLDVGRGRPA